MRLDSHRLRYDIGDKCAARLPTDAMLQFQNGSVEGYTLNDCNHSNGHDESNKGIASVIHYPLRDPIYEQEKPYICGFPVDEIAGAKSTNVDHYDQLMFINDIRTSNQHHLDTSGFTFARFPTALAPEDFDTFATVRERYFPEVKRYLLREFPHYDEIIYMDHNHRVRDPAFPLLDGAITAKAQPLTLPHRDFTTTGATQRLAQIVEADGLQHLAGRSFDQLNIWRVTKGPNNDWPLALVDFRTVDKVNDPLDTDFIFLDAPTELSILRYNTNHEWYYMSDQDVEDVMIFRNADSEGTMPCSWHASFDTRSNKGKEVSQQQMRESIDIRCFAFRRLA